MSSKVIPFVIPRPTFTVAAKTWLKVTQAHPLLTGGSKVFCTALYLHFNCKHYKTTGELLAWPSWDKLSAEYGLSRTTIHDSINEVERLGLLEVERGGYDRAAQKRLGNRYRVPKKFMEQGSPNEPNLGSPNRLYLGDSPFLSGESRLGEELEEAKEGRGLPRKEGQTRKLTKIEEASLLRLAATAGSSR